MSRFTLLRAGLVAIMAAAPLIPFVPAAQAEADGRTFLMPENDGYGLGDCLAAGPNSSCGRVVADAWCASKGFAKARTFGRAEPADITGSLVEPNRPLLQPALQSSPMVVIACDA